MAGRQGFGIPAWSAGAGWVCRQSETVGPGIQVCTFPENHRPFCASRGDFEAALERPPPCLCPVSYRAASPAEVPLGEAAGRVPQEQVLCDGWMALGPLGCGGSCTGALLSDSPSWSPSLCVGWTLGLCGETPALVSLHLDREAVFGQRVRENRPHIQGTHIPPSFREQLLCLNFSC